MPAMRSARSDATRLRPAPRTQVSAYERAEGLRTAFYLWTVLWRRAQPQGNAADSASICVSEERWARCAMLMSLAVYSEGHAPSAGCADAMTKHKHSRRASGATGKQT